MKRDLSATHSRERRRGGIRLCQAVALSLALTMPSGATGERAVKSRVAPVYPEIAKRLKIEGTVKIEATVDADGKVSEVKTLTGAHVLSSAAEEAVRKWRFAPSEAQTKVEVEVNFAAQQ